MAVERRLRIGSVPSTWLAPFSGALLTLPYLVPPPVCAPFLGVHFVHRLRSRPPNLARVARLNRSIYEPLRALAVPEHSVHPLLARRAFRKLPVGLRRLVTAPTSTPLARRYIRDRSPFRAQATEAMDPITGRRDMVRNAPETSKESHGHRTAPELATARSLWARHQATVLRAQLLDIDAHPGRDAIDLRGRVPGPDRLHRLAVRILPDQRDERRLVPRWRARPPRRRPARLA